MPQQNDPIALVGEIKATIESMKKDSEAVNTQLKESVEKTGAEAKEAIKIANELSEKIQGQAQSLVEMEQKLADGVISGKAAPKTLGDIVIESDAFKEYAAGNTSKFRIQANTIIGQEGSPPENSDTLVPAQRVPGIIPGAFRSLRVREALPQGVTESNAVEYTRELAFTNNAAETEEGGQKPESSLTFELESAPVRTIAHFIKASKQVLEDAAALRSYIDTRMRYGVDLRYDNQLLNGDGDGQNISGILDSGNHTVFTPEADDNALDSLNRAQEKVGLADYAATAYILNTADWHAIERLKVGDSDDRYVIGDPLSGIGRRLWGLPVIVTNQIPQGTFVCGALDIAYQVWNRMGTVVEIFEQDDTNVQKNLLTIRGEVRGTLATYRPASVQAGLLVAAAST